MTEHIPQLYWLYQETVRSIFGLSTVELAAPEDDVNPAPMPNGGSASRRESVE